MYSAPDHNMTLFGATISAVLALVGCGTSTGAPAGAGSDRRCSETAHVGEYACVDGQLPPNHEALNCVLYSSMYSIDLWRCT
jgi:hypothetical protein